MKPIVELQPLLLPEPVIQQSNSRKHTWCGVKEGFYHLLGKVLDFPPWVLFNPTVAAVSVRCLLLPWLQGILCPSRVWAQPGLSGSNFGDVAMPAVPRSGHRCCVLLVWVLQGQLRDCSPLEFCGKLSTKKIDFSVHLS